MVSDALCGRDREINVFFSDHVTWARLTGMKKRCLVRKRLIFLALDVVYFASFGFENTKLCIEWSSIVIVCMSCKVKYKMKKRAKKKNGHFFSLVTESTC